MSKKTQSTLAQDVLKKSGLTEAEAQAIGLETMMDNVRAKFVEKLADKVCREAEKLSKKADFESAVSLQKSRLAEIKEQKKALRAEEKSLRAEIKELRQQLRSK